MMLSSKISLQKIPSHLIHSIRLKQKSAGLHFDPPNEFKVSPYKLETYVSKLGYPLEIHKNIKTDDGYLLSMFRIPFGKTEKKSKIPVFLMHGLGTSGESWIIPGPKYSLAFLLADEGYDVWLGNARGTSHSKKHRILSAGIDDAQFWDFSWHEIGKYDLYAKIQHILEITNQNRIFYIGHSQGCTTFFVFASTRPEMNGHIKMFFGLAPIVFSNSKAKIIPENTAFSVFRQLDKGRRALGLHKNFESWRIRQLFCDSELATHTTCELYSSQIKSFLEFDPKKTRPEHLDLIKSLVPESYSAKQMLHYIQTSLTGTFGQYHLGLMKNVLKYASQYPPVYDLKEVSAPVALFTGELDQQASVENSKKLGLLLPNVVHNETVKDFEHGDFVAADKAAELVYPKIFELMSKHQK